MSKENVRRCTSVIRLYLGWVSSGLDWSTRLQLGVGVLREVSHHTEFVHVSVDHILGTKQLHSGEIEGT